jgi:tRNA 2-selenouridine synthase SelU
LSALVLLDAELRVVRQHFMEAVEAKGGWHALSILRSEFTPRLQRLVALTDAAASPQHQQGSTATACSWRVRGSVQ